jgi:hypothetical protein
MKGSPVKQSPNPKGTPQTTSPQTVAEVLRKHVVLEVESIDRIPLITFENEQRKDDVAAKLRAKFPHREGVVFVGKAQEKCTVYRTEKRHNPKKIPAMPGSSNRQR